MDAREKATRFSKGISEGLNCLGVLLCGPAFRRLRPDVHQVLGWWEREFTPLFREAVADRPGALAALGALSKAAAQAPADAPLELATVRRAVRELFVSLWLPVASPSPAESAVCELHGPSCPMIESARDE